MFLSPEERERDKLYIENMMNNITHKGVFLSTERLITLNIDILD